MLSTSMTLNPIVLEDTMVVYEYLEAKYSEFIMVSANVLGFKDMLDALVTLKPLVMYKY